MSGLAEKQNRRMRSMRHLTPIQMDETAVFGIALGTASASIALNKVRERDGKIYALLLVDAGI